MSPIRIEVGVAAWIRYPVFLGRRQLFCDLWQIRDRRVPSSGVCRDPQVRRDLVELVAPVLNMHVLS